jgi:hypothetical protein
MAREFVRLRQRRSALLTSLPMVPIHRESGSSVLVKQDEPCWLEDLPSDGARDHYDLLRVPAAAMQSHRRRETMLDGG